MACSPGKFWHTVQLNSMVRLFSEGTQPHPISLQCQKTPVQEKKLIISVITLSPWWPEEGDITILPLRSWRMLGSPKEDASLLCLSTFLWEFWVFGIPQQLNQIPPSTVLFPLLAALVRKCYAFAPLLIILVSDIAMCYEQLSVLFC